MFPEWTWIVGFFIGASIGSFLNVVIYRLPRGLSVYRPAHSFCPSCDKRLSASELIPLFSWILQRGKCQCGKNKIGPRYFIVELVNGILCAAVWHQQFVKAPFNDPDSIILGVGYILFVSALVAAIFTDIAHYIIPDQVNGFLLATGLGMNVAFIAVGSERAYMWGMPSSIAGALVGFGILWGITFFGRIAFGKDAMGHGDIKMARGIGAVLLPLLAGISFGLAVFLGAIFGIVQVALRKKQTEEEVPEDEEPYEPESLGSILKCGLGYLLCIDVVGLAWPKLYEAWFNENPYASEVIDGEPEVELMMIPFGPYLAAGACVQFYLVHNCRSLS
ncbi:prepilin peptidase [Geitlerinema splendidum]|nr:prepilin peptidase [Geitlerinema splendidum]